MTLVVCMKAQDGIVLAPDSRGTIGVPRGLTAIDDAQMKQAGLGNYGLGLSGAGEIGAALLGELRETTISSITDVDQAVTQLAAECRTLFGRWFGNTPPENRPAVLLTVAGYRGDATGSAEAVIYVLGSQLDFVPSACHPICLSGAPQYVVDLAHRCYQESITLDQAKALAEHLVSVTASHDPRVGEPAKIATITPGQGYVPLSDDAVSEVRAHNAGLKAAILRFFSEGVPD